MVDRYVLEWAHSARIDINVGVDLDAGDNETPTL